MILHFINPLHLLYFFVFIFGSIIGSFLNVVILRFNTGRGVHGRSGCFTCSKPLKWYELIPIVSFLVLKGRCKSCKTGISVQYPLVETITGALFVFLAYSNALFTAPGLLSSVLFTLDAVIWSTLIVIIVYDLKHMIIPDSLSAFFVLLTAIRLAVFWKFGLAIGHDLLMYGLAAIVLAGFFFALWLVSSGRWIGLGDAKIAVGMGLYLGLAQGLSSFAFAFWIGAGFALTKMFISFIMGKFQLRKGEKSITMKSEIPFAPFLILGMLLAYALGSDMFQLSLFIS